MPYFMSYMACMKKYLRFLLQEVSLKGDQCNNVGISIESIGAYIDILINGQCSPFALH